MKYRLKKDTPEFEAGQMFTRRKYDYGDYGDDCLFADISPGVSPVPAFDISLIDNFDEWFEEAKEKKEPEWVRKQIKEVQGKNIHINYMVVKTFYLPVGEWDSEHKAAFRMEPGDVAGFAEYDEDVKGYINQMVELGFIEVEDNPNIVWEDEKCD